MSHLLKKNFSIMIVLIVLITAFLPQFENVSATLDYATQQIEFSTLNGKALSVNDISDNSQLIVKTSTGNSTERFKLTYVNDGFYKIVNIGSGRLVSTSSWKTSSGAKGIIFGDANKQEQCWYIVGVDKDSLGNYLTYKITNYKNSNMALTYNSDNTVTLSTYTGSSNQKWRINSAGLEGFAAYGKDMNGNEKAGTIGGLLGETVYVNSISDFEKYSKDNTSRTIVINSNLSSPNLTKVKIGKNKTIIGAYGTSISNIYFYLDKSNPSGNLIMKNITFKHNASINENNDIQLYINEGNNFWIDHCTFEGHDMSKDLNIHANDVDKLMYVGVKADYVTVSHCKFANHKYGLILGYPSDDVASQETYTGYPRMTLSNNYFTNMTCRAPGLMRYGYFHSYNNYIENVHLAYTACTNATIYSEKNYFNNVNGIVDDYGTSTFTDEGSYPNVTASKSPSTSWRPYTNYSYTTMDISTLRSFCTSYAGAQNTKENYNYAIFDSKGVPSSGFVYGSDPSNNISNTTNEILDGGIYYIKNVNSNLYLDVENGSSENGTNLRQFTGNGYNAQKFKLVSTGNGYYKIVSLVGDGTKVLDINKKSSANGTNIALYTDNGGINQQFKLIPLGNNRFNIVTRVSNDLSAMEVVNASTSNGANIQQWSLNGNMCQVWKLELAQ